MRKVLTILALLAASSVAWGQVSISASSVEDSSNTPFASARLCFMPVNAAEQPVGFRVGAEQVIPTEICWKVISGALGSGHTLAPNVSGTYYHIYVKSMASNYVLRDFGMTPITGTAWTLDSYDPAIASVPATALTVGTVTGLSNGSTPTATLTPGNPVQLNLGIPAGATGATGPTGPQGPAGTPAAGSISGLASDGSNGISVTANGAFGMTMPSGALAGSVAIAKNLYFGTYGWYLTTNDLSGNPLTDASVNVRAEMRMQDNLTSGFPGIPAWGCNFIETNHLCIGADVPPGYTGAGSKMFEIDENGTYQWGVGGGTGEDLSLFRTQNPSVAAGGGPQILQTSGNFWLADNLQFNGATPSITFPGTTGSLAIDGSSSSGYQVGIGNSSGSTLLNLGSNASGYGIIQGGQTASPYTEPIYAQASGGDFGIGVPTGNALYGALQARAGTNEDLMVQSSSSILTLASLNDAGATAEPLNIYASETWFPDGDVGIGVPLSQSIAFQVQIRVGTNEDLGFYNNSGAVGMESVNDANSALETLDFAGSQFVFAGGVIKAQGGLYAGSSNQLTVSTAGALATSSTISSTTGYVANGTTGVTCATGSPTSSFAAVLGIVTHC